MHTNINIYIYVKGVGIVAGSGSFFRVVRTSGFGYVVPLV